MANSDHTTAIQLAPGARMPIFKASDNVLLMIILTELTEEERLKLVHYYQKDCSGGVELETWTPSKALLRSIAKQGSHWDSQANLYALAILAFQSGLQFKKATSFVVANELTKRQLTRCCRPGERDYISLVTMTVRPKPSMVAHIDSGLNPHFATMPDDEIYVFTDRSTESPKKLLPEVVEPQTMEFFAEYLRLEKTREISNCIQSGRRLHDPDSCIFTVGTAMATGRERYCNTVTSVLSACDFPPELVAEVISQSDSAVSAKMPLWNRRQSRRHLIIFLLFPTTASELQRNHTIIQDALNNLAEGDHGGRKGMSVELISQHRHQARSRREVLELWEEFRLHEGDERAGDPVLNVLLGPIEDQDIGSALFAAVCSEHRHAKYMIRAPLSSIVRIKWKEHFYFIQEELERLELNQIEGVCDPDQPWYFNPPSWRPANDDKELRPGREDIGYASVFYLTKDFPENRDRQIRKDLMKDDVDEDIDSDSENDPPLPKGVCFVPWDGKDDATQEDIWNIVWEFYKYEGLGRMCPSFFCIDQTSASDMGTVLLVKPDIFKFGKMLQSQEGYLKGVLGPRLRGFLATRVLIGSAQQSKTDAEDGFQPMADIGLNSNVTRFYRPEWPARGVLPFEWIDLNGGDGEENEYRKMGGWDEYADELPWDDIERIRRE
ncbi:hypothetical protein N7490_004987 [Penicillium lividum]|nr:hypothetical protein N7490_004987 [Penicillium lividum]